MPCFRGAIAVQYRWYLYCSNSCESKCWNPLLLGAHFKEENFKEVAKMRESLYSEEKDDAKAIQEIKEKFKSTYFPENNKMPYTPAPNEAGVKGNTDVKPSEPIKITRNTSLKDLMTFKK